MERNYFAAIELNSIYSSCLVMTYVNDQLYPVAFDKVLTSGFSDGNIVDPLLFENTVSKLLDEIKRKFKIEVDEAVLVLPNNKHSISSEHNQYRIKTEHLIIRKSEINQCRKDMKKTSDEAKKNGLTFIEEVPTLYELDNNRRFRTEPINLSSSSLIIHSNIHYLPADLVNSHVEELEKNHVRVLDAFINCDCSAYGTSKRFELEDDSICIDIGQDVTTIAIYSKSLLIGSSRVTFGVKQLVEKLVKSLNISFAEALIIFDSYFIANIDIASEIEFDKEKNLNEKRVSGIILNAINSGIEDILQEIKILKNKLQITSNCTYILSGLLNDHEEFVEKFIELTNLPVISHNLNVLCIDDTVYKNCYGAIRKFVDNNIDYVKERLTIDETDNLSNPQFVVSQNINNEEQENGSENEENPVENIKKENTRKQFHDIFDD